MGIETLGSCVRKARKTHICSYCGEPIPAGQQYQCDKLKYDGIYEWKAHISCSRIAQFLWPWADPGDYGLDSEQFQETCREFCAEYICPTCELWDGEDCQNDNGFCGHKIYKLSLTHNFKRVNKDSGWPAQWELVPKNET